MSIKAEDLELPKTNDEMKAWLKSYISVHGPVKGTVLASQPEFALFKGDIVEEGQYTAFDVLHDMLVDEEIVEWEYRNPETPWRTKSLYSIKGTELVQ